MKETQNVSRRDFLKISGLVTAGLLAAACQPVQPVESVTDGISVTGSSTMTPEEAKLLSEHAAKIPVYQEIDQEAVRGLLTPEKIEELKAGLHTGNSIIKFYELGQNDGENQFWGTSMTVLPLQDDPNTIKLFGHSDTIQGPTINLQGLSTNEISVLQLQQIQENQHGLIDITSDLFLVRPIYDSPFMHKNDELFPIDEIAAEFAGFVDNMERGMEFYGYRQHGH